MTSYFVFGCALFVFVITLILVLHPQYEDGIIGKLGLICLSFAALARLSNLAEVWIAVPAAALNYPKIGALFWVGLSPFPGHHFYNFCRFKEPTSHVTSANSQPS